MPGSPAATRSILAETRRRTARIASVVGSSSSIAHMYFVVSWSAKRSRARGAAPAFRASQASTSAPKSRSTVASTGGASNLGGRSAFHETVFDGVSVRSRSMSNQAASPRPSQVEHTVDSPSSTESSSRRNLPTARRCAADRGRIGAKGITRAGRVGGVAGAGSGKRLARLALFFSTARIRSQRSGADCEGGTQPSRA